MLAPAATIGGLSLLTLALHVRDPHEHGSWGLCPSAAMGFYCPGCGGLRAVNDLTHGDVGAALSSNIARHAAHPGGHVGLLGSVASGSWQGRPSRTTRCWSPAGRWSPAVTVAVVFAVVRNLSVGAWLAPGEPACSVGCSRSSCPATPDAIEDDRGR